VKSELSKPSDAHDAQAASLRLLFLDIDGVLNDRVFDETAQSCTLLSSCVAELNQVLARTECRIVLSSAWRYAVINGWMSLDGFEYLLRSHGVAAGGRIDGVIRVHPNAAPLKLLDDGRTGLAGFRHPRSSERGPIEASMRIFVWSVPAMPSAFIRTRPH